MVAVPAVGDPGQSGHERHAQHLAQPYRLGGHVVRIAQPVQDRCPGGAVRARGVEVRADGVVREALEDDLRASEHARVGCVLAVLVLTAGEDERPSPQALAELAQGVLAACGGQFVESVEDQQDAVGGAQEVEGDVVGADPGHGRAHLGTVGGQLPGQPLGQSPARVPGREGDHQRDGPGRVRGACVQQFGGEPQGQHRLARARTAEDDEPPVGGAFEVPGDGGPWLVPRGRPLHLDGVGFRDVQQRTAAATPRRDRRRPAGGAPATARPGHASCAARPAHVRPGRTPRPGPAAASRAEPGPGRSRGGAATRAVRRRDTARSPRPAPVRPPPRAAGRAGSRCRAPG